MIYRILEALDNKSKFQRANAHCDVPCGIYDPISAQIAALTVVRMVDLMNGLDAEDIAYQNSMSRYVAVKEEHAEKAKHEVRIIWGDFFKEPQFEQYPELGKLTHTIMLFGSKSRQTADREAAVEFVENINKFAEIFWAIKGVKTKRATAPYAPALEMVYPDL